MRKTATLTLLFLMAFAWGSISAQQVQTAPDAQVTMGNKRIAGLDTDHTLRGVTNCIDTLQYTFFKASAVNNVLVYDASTEAAAQYFDCPGTLNLNGFNFYALSLDNAALNVTISIYNAGADSLPVGAPVATTSVVVDTAFGSGTLEDVRRVANFSTPVTLSQPYVVSVENSTSDRLVVYSNDYNGPDGAGEYLGLLNIGGTWAYGYQVALGPVPFDADWLIEPFISFDLAADIGGADCYEVGTALTLPNNSTGFATHRMYSVATAAGFPEDQFTWNYGDGTAASNSVDGNHTYTMGGMAYTVSLLDTMIMWSGTCASDTSKVLNEGVNPVSAFTSVNSGSTVDFTDASTGGITTYAWDFGDGNTSTMASPTHTYVSDGDYAVCLTVSNPCGSNTTCDTVSINTVSIDSELERGIQLYPNPAAEQLFVGLDLTTEADVTLNIYNLHGAQLRTIGLGTLSADKVALDLNDLPNGTYLLEISTGTDRAVKRFNVLR